MDNYGTPPLALASGDGAVVTDADGKSYLDLLGGIAVNVLGHRHPAVIEAVDRPAEHAGPHLEPLRHRTRYRAGRGAGRPARCRRPARVFFCNSGTEANEVAFKITRLTGRTKLVAAEGAFHGRTMGSLALTGQPAKQAPFEPLPGDVTHVPYGDVDALDAAVDRRHRGGVPRTDHGGGRRRRPAGGLPGRGPRDHRRATVRCWCSTRCRPASAAPARSSPTSTTASPPTWSPWPRGSAAACRSGRAWPSAPPRTC